jgi:hypothetical protein
MSLQSVKPGTGGLAEKTPSGILSRAARRVDFDGEPLFPDVLAFLRGVATGSGASLRFVTEEGERTAVATLVAEAERVLFADPGYRLALGSRWRPRPAEESEQHGDEDSGALLPVPDLFPGLGSFYVSEYDLADLQARRDFRLAARAPLLVVVAAPETPEGRAAALEAARRLVGAAEEAGLAACFFNQPVFAPEVGRRLAGRFALDAPPQVLLAVGVPRSGSHG